MAEVAWTAGFYSGEGCTHVQQRKGGNHGTRYYVNMSIGNTDLECLERCRAVIGGAIYGPTTRSENRKPMYMLKIMSGEAVDAALVTLMPYLSREKQDQAKRCQAFVQEHQPPRAPTRGWPKGKPRGRTRRGGEPCGKGHPGEQTYEYTDPQGRASQKCRACQSGRDADRRSVPEGQPA